MAITIQPLLKEDIPTKIRIELEAFKNHPRIPMMWANGYNAELYSFKESEDRDGYDQANNYYWKAVDSETGEIIAAAEWSFRLDVEADAQQKPVDEETPPPADWPEGGNWPLRRFYKINFQKMKREYLGGKPYIMLNFLTVLPQHQGRGAGKLLLDWGLAEADKRHVQACLESTPAGMSLYTRAGFVTAEVIAADMHAFGWTESYDEKAAERIFMIRGAR